MTTIEEFDEVTIECRECGEQFQTADPLVIYCDDCVDAKMRKLNLTSSYVAR